MTPRPGARRVLAYAGIGLVAGFLSGLFGVGGGVLIVPALVILLRFEQKLASGTSLLAIAPISLVGVLAYLGHGGIDWSVGIPLAVGMVAGGALGSWLLARVPAIVVTWVFIAVLAAVAIRLFFEEPVRGVSRELSWAEIALLVAFGVLTGVISGLVGVGAGVIIVPSLIVFWGIGDLVAKGASLLAMLPNAITTSAQNLLRRNADLVAGLVIGGCGAAATVLGTAAAVWVEPRLGAILFGAFLLAVAVQLAVRTARRMRRGRG